MSEELFKKMAPIAEITGTTKSLLGIKERMQVIGRCAEDIHLEFYSTRDQQRVKYKCKLLIVRDCNIDFLLSNADLCKLDVSIRPAAEAMRVPIGPREKNQPRKMMIIPLAKKPLKSTPVYAIADETIYPGKEIEFSAFTEQRVGYSFEPVIGACTLDVV